MKYFEENFSKIVFLISICSLAGVLALNEIEIASSRVSTR